MRVSRPKSGMTSPLENELLLLLISSRASIETLRTLALLGLWPVMREFASDGVWWHMRTEHKAGRELKWQAGEWKTVYWNLSCPDSDQRLLHYDTARVLLECGYDDTRQRSGDLITVAGAEDLRVLSMFVERGWINLTQTTVEQAVRVVAQTGHVEAMRLLQQKYKREMGQVDVDSACSFAAGLGHTSLVTLLLQNERVDPSGWSSLAIHTICERGHASTLALVASKVSVDKLNRGLVLACYGGRPGMVAVVDLLLDQKGIDPRTDNDEPLMAAARSGDPNLVRLLLGDQRVKPNANGNKAIRYAVRAGNYDCVEQLMRLTSKKDGGVNPWVEKSRAFREACALGHLEIARLLAKDKRVKAYDDCNRPLKEAVRYGHVPVVRWLLTLDGVSPMSSCDSPLLYASTAGVLDVLLRDQRVDLDVVSSGMPRWMGILRGKMEERLIACSLAGVLVSGASVGLDEIVSWVASPTTLYFRLMQFILVKRPVRCADREQDGDESREPSDVDLMDWLIAQNDERITAAARSVYLDDDSARGEGTAVYRALLSTVVHRQKGDVLLIKMRELGCDESEVLDAARLLAVYVGLREVSGWRLDERRTR